VDDAQLDLERFAMLGQYKELSESLATDPGAVGLLVLVSLVCLNVIMQVAISTFSTQWFRVATLGVTVAYAAFFCCIKWFILLAVSRLEFTPLSTLLTIYWVAGVLGVLGDGTKMHNPALSLSVLSVLNSTGSTPFGVGNGRTMHIVFLPVDNFVG
jgi:hypothetical protein